MNFLKVKSVPVVAWSSANPLNFRPRASTLIWLIIGLFLFGTGETLLIAAGAGVSPWTVFAQGISVTFGIGIGLATLYIGIGVLLLWIPLKRTPGIGTVLNVLIIAGVIEFILPYIPNPASDVMMGAQTIAGILLVGLGSGFYLVANLGAGPRDGLMTGLQQVTNAPIAWVRLSIEITVTIIGWILGGVVGVGTVLFAIGIGPAVSTGLYLVAACSGEQSKTN
jgi:uncharacterized membrane protein YczE